MSDPVDEISAWQAVAQPAASPDEEALARRHGDVDPVRSYLAQITRIRRITPDDEAKIVAGLTAAEASLQATLDTMGFAMAHYAAVAEDIAAGRERLDRSVMERRVPDREEFRRRLGPLCAELRGHIDECGRRYAELAGGDARGRQGARAAFRRALSLAQGLVPSLCFKPRVNADFVALLADLAVELAAIEERQRMAAERGADAGELREFERRAWMSAEVFRQKMAAAREADAACAAAKRALIESHLWLVVLIARRYACQGMGFLDLVQEGNLGLMRAADMYECAAGCRFGSYASWWIRQAITRSISDHARLIRLPVYLGATAGAMLRVQRQLAADLGQEPTPEDIAEEMRMPVAKVNAILGALRQPLSLQSRVGDDQDAPELGELIEDPNATSPAEAAGRHLLGDRLHEVLSSLTRQERMVMMSRYGLTDSTSRSMREVGLQVNLRPQRIQQIEARALKKLRHPVRVRMLNRLLGRGLS